MHVDVGRVDDEVGLLPQPRHEAALLVDPIDHPLRHRQRMPAPGGLEAPDDGLVRGFQEQDPVGDAQSLEVLEPCTCERTDRDDGRICGIKKRTAQEVFDFKTDYFERVLVHEIRFRQHRNPAAHRK